MKKLFATIGAVAVCFAAAEGLWALHRIIQDDLVYKYFIEH